MKAVIVGGGIAGPALGIALRRAGIDAVVLERRAEVDPEEGSYFTVGPNGLDALATLGVRDAAAALGFPSRSTTMHGGIGGRRLGEVPLGSRADDGTVALTLKRSRLAALLGEEAARRGVELRSDAHVRSTEGAAAVLEDGTRVEGDVLVGADGVHSRVRSQIDAAAPTGRYVGLTNFGGITEGTPLARELQAESWHFTFGARAFFGAHPTPRGDVVWFANVPRPEIDPQERTATSREEWRRWLLELVAGDRGPAQQLLAAGRLELVADNTYDLPHVPVWSRDGAVLIGDAAHAPSPSSGQGASMALEDAVVLAMALRDAPSVAQALATYERLRRRRVERIVAAGARTGSAKIAGPLGRRVQERLMPLVFRYLVTQRSIAWMTDHRIDWEERIR